ncbi:MAG: hypothetical protein GX769_02440 [Erysipelothrix sp.]|nr:hypothetical protein [Erysipelothrix sp.]
MYKKRIALFSLLIVMSISGCGVKDKISEKVVEKVIEQTDGVKKVGIDKDKVTIEGDEGEKYTFGGTEWPEAEIAKVIPKFEKGTIISVVEMPNMLMMSFDEVLSADFSDYLDLIKDQFPLEPYQVNSEGYFSYMGINDKEQTMHLTYSEGSMSISLVLNEE